MLRLQACLLIGALSAAAFSAHALDRLHFKGMPDSDLYAILTAFQHVKIHYLVTGDGKSILASMNKRNPKVSEVTKFGVFTYVNPKDAESARLAYERSSNVKAQVRTAPASKIIEAQFARRNSAPSRGEHEPDFVIFLSAAPKLDVIEYLEGANHLPFAFKAKAGGIVVLAFLDQNRAIQMQNELQAKGTKADRVALDERSFLAFIIAQSKEGRHVVIQGF